MAPDSLRGLVYVHNIPSLQFLPGLRSLLVPGGLNIGLMIRQAGLENRATLASCVAANDNLSAFINLLSLFTPMSLSVVDRRDLETP